MTSKTERESQIPPTQRESVAAPTEREGGTSAPPGFTGGLFPRSLAARFAKIEALDHCGGEADCYLLTDESQTVFGKIYHRGKSPNAEVMARLSGAAADKVVRVIEFAPAAEGEKAWELLEHMREGSLVQLIEREGPRLPEARVRQVLEEIVDALAHVHRLQVEHRDLKPANVLIRSMEPFDLVLADFGIASAIDETMRLTGGHQTQAYGPPEAYSGAVFKERWDSWSLGMMLVEMLTGRHPLMLGNTDHGDEMHQRRMRSVLAVGDPDDLVGDVKGKHWIKLCRGLLRRNPKVRWTTKQVLLWLKNPDDLDLVVADERPASNVAPFRCRGADYHSPEQLAAALRAAPDVLADLWKRRSRELFKWIADDLALTATFRALEKVESSNEPLDCQLMRVLQILDPHQPPKFGDAVLDPAGLVAIADEAANGSAGARSLIVRLYRDDVLAKGAEPSPDRKALQAIVAAWRRAVADYETGRERLERESGGTAAPPSADGDTLALLLAAATPGSAGGAVVERLAGAAMTPAAGSSLWFQTLGQPHPSRPADNLLIINTAANAAAEVKAAERQRADGIAAIWTAVSAGAGIGGAVGLVWWGSVAAWCDNGQELCVQSGWDELHINGYGLIFLALAAATAFFVLLSVHQQTGRRY